MQPLLHIYQQLIEALDRAGPWVGLLLLRLLIGWEFLEAGLEKYNGQNWFGQVRDDFLFPFNLLPAEWSWNMATWFELVGGVALIVGLGTRFFALSLMVLTIVATAAVHWPADWSTLAELAQGFNHLPAAELPPEQVAEALLQLIANSHQALGDAHPQAACSYLVLCLLSDAAFSIHEGDCCLGLIEQSGTIDWLNSAHCAANWQGNLTHAEIAQAPSRHRLTRCFSARRASNPEINHWPLEPNQHWLLATDGFWAGLSPQEQQSFLRDGNLPAPPTDDDISCLSIITLPT